MQVDGVILAGGKSTRMGSNKSQILLNNKPLINHVFDRLHPQVGKIWISTNVNLEQFPENIQFKDQLEESFGPLTGVYSGLKQAQTDWVQFCPNDCPLLPANLVSELKKFITQANAEIIIPRVDGFLEPTFILCSKSLADDIPLYVKKQGEKLQKWVMAHNYICVDFNDKKPFTNINNKDDLALIENA